MAGMKGKQQTRPTPLLHHTQLLTYTTHIYQHIHLGMIVIHQLALRKHSVCPMSFCQSRANHWNQMCGEYTLLAHESGGHICKAIMSCGSLPVPACRPERDRNLSTTAFEKYPNTEGMVTQKLHFAVMELKKLCFETQRATVQNILNRCSQLALPDKSKR